jgi:hypothetical protein
LEYFSYTIGFSGNFLLNQTKFGKQLINKIYIKFLTGFPEPFYVLETGFQNSFITTAVASQKNGKPLKMYKNYPKDIILPKKFLLNRANKLVLDRNSWRASENVKSTSGSYSWAMWQNN